MSDPALALSFGFMRCLHGLFLKQCLAIMIPSPLDQSLKRHTVPTAERVAGCHQVV